LKLSIPADLITINCNKVEEGKKALEYSSREIDFKNIYFFSDQDIKGNFEHIKIGSIRGVSEYNNFILGIEKYITSEHVLVIQDDGHVLNPKHWTDEFLKYDYIGAPWPNDEKWNKRWDKYGKNISEKIRKHAPFNRVGNGGFSLRSTNFLKYSNLFSNTGVLAEDIFLTLYNYDKAQEFGIKFPDLDLALKFSYETALKGKELRKEYKNQKLNLDNHFGWHGKKFQNTEEIMKIKNTKSENN
jgi:hypothetical protein